MGCCAVTAVRNWAFFVFLAGACLVGASAYLYTTITPLVDAITTVAAALLDLATSSTAGQQAMQGIPTGILKQIETYKAYLAYAVMAPAVIAILFMYLSAICGMKRNPKGFCCMKFLNFVAHLIVFLALAFYIVFAVLGIAMEQPVVKAELNTVTSQCSSNLPTLQADFATAQGQKAICDANPSCTPTPTQNRQFREARVALRAFQVSA